MTETLDLPTLDSARLEPAEIARVGFVREPVDPALDLFEEIERLKKEKSAVLLAHYYQEPDIQDIADYIGDSLGLAREAAQTDADVIVFAGVHFMAETAKILNPEKTVLLPDLHAGCSLADSCPPDAFAAFRAEHPDHLVVSYINCSAAIKAQTDIICTSSNAEHIVRQIPESQPILFAPDRNLGRWLINETGRDMLLWDGACIVHEIFSEQKLIRLKIRPPRRPCLGSPRVRRARPPPRRSRRQHVVDPPVRGRVRRRHVHRGDRVRHPPPDAEGQPGEDVRRRPARQRGAPATTART